MSNLPEKTGQILLLTDFELRKLFRQKQGYAGLVVIVLLVALCAAGVYMRINHPHHGPVKYQGQMIRELVNGISFSMTVLLPGIYILLPMVIGIFAAGSLAGELQNGQLRTVSLRSVPRLSIVLAKFISLSVYSYALLGLMLVVSYATGAFIFGYKGDILIFGPAFLGKGSEVFIMSGDVAFQRLFLSYFFAGYALISITAMFLMFSVIFRGMAMAVVVPLGIYFISYILGVLPFMENIQRFLPTRYIMIWKYTMAQDIMWDSMAGDGIFLAVYTVCYLVIAAVMMNSSDL